MLNSVLGKELLFSAGGGTDPFARLTNNCPSLIWAIVAALVAIAGMDVVPVRDVAGDHGDVPHDPVSAVLLCLDIGVRVLDTPEAL